MADEQVMIAAHCDSEEFGGWVTLTVRICPKDKISRVRDLMIKQIRSRFSHFAEMKPSEIKEVVRFTVYSPEGNVHYFPKWGYLYEHWYPDW